MISPTAEPEDASLPQVEARIRVPVSPALAFAVSQTTGATRLRWDPFIRRQHFLDGAERADRGVRTFTRSRHGLSMISRYVSYAPPTADRGVGNVGMTMERGPWFFETFGGGWRFTTDGAGGTEAVWKYTFRCRPAWLRFLLHPIGRRLLGRDIRRRIAGFARGCADPEVLAAVADTPQAPRRSARAPRAEASERTTRGPSTGSGHEGPSTSSGQETDPRR